MSSNHYNKLDNLYTKTEIDTLIENIGGSDLGNYQDISLGDHVTETQSANIANGRFKDLPLGAYWYMNNTKYRIMAQDQFYGYNGISTHHVVVMPTDSYGGSRYNAYNNDTNVGGYVSSLLKTYVENSIYTMITNDFGENHILSHTHDLTSGTYNNGTLTPTTNTKAWLINSYNLNGSKYTNETNYNWQNADKVQFPTFYYNPDLKKLKYGGSIGRVWWLGTSANTSYRSFCYVDTGGSIGTAGSTYRYSDYVDVSVQPAFLVY